MNVGNALRVGESVRSALLSSGYVTAIIGNGVYPYTTQVEVSRPHVVYDGINVVYGDTKDGVYCDYVELSVHCNASEYGVGIGLTTGVVDVLLEYGARVVSVGCDFDSSLGVYVHTINIVIDL